MFSHLKLKLCLILFGIVTIVSDMEAAPTATRPSPYPSYTVGETATVIVTTSPPQPNAKVYRFRLKNGVPDGDQPTEVGTTDGAGRLEIDDVALGIGNIGDYSDERFAVGSPTGPLSNTLEYSIHAASPPVSTRPAPFPSYQVGDTAINVITTDPPQPDQPVRRFRYRNGLPDGPQGILLGHTDGQGTLTIEATPTVAEIGHYTSERFTVGTFDGPRSIANNYYVHAAVAPTAVRAAPYPTYSVGETATLDIATSPAQPAQRVYRFRYKDGSPDGSQPTVIGTTEDDGTLHISYVLTEDDVGAYSSERFAVGTPSGPRSTARSYTVGDAVILSQPPAAVRAAPFPSYLVGDDARLTLTTDPPQPQAPVYRFRLRDGEQDGAQPTHIGDTDAQGVYDITLSLPASMVGTYSDERFAVGDPDGPTSSPLSYTVSEPVIPEITSISTDLLAQGVVTRVVLHGENLDGGSVWVDGAAPLPGVSVVGGASDGSRLDVDIDTTAIGLRGYFTLVVSHGAHDDRAAFEVAPPGPAISGFSPPSPLRGQTYLLVIFGQNLGDATVTSSHPRVKILVPGAGSGAIHLSGNPPDDAVHDDGAIQGLIHIEPDVPIGPVQLLVHAQGGSTAVTLNVRDSDTSSVFAGVHQYSISELALAKTGRALESMPDIQVQDFHLDRQPIFAKTGSLEPHADCAGRASFRAYYQRAEAYALEGGEALTLATMALGIPRDFSTLTMAAYFDAQARLYWHCDPAWDESRIDWAITLGFQIVGIYSIEFTIRPDNGRVVISHETQSLFDYFRFEDDACLDIVGYDEPNGFFFGTHRFTAAQDRCCRGSVPISFTAPIFPGSAIAAATLYAHHAVVLSTEPSEEQCPCLYEGEEPTECPAHELDISEISFEGDISLLKDALESVAATPITDPVWIRPDATSGSQKSDPVAYPRNRQLEVSAKLGISPAVETPYLVTVRATGPEGLMFCDQEVWLSGEEVVVNMLSEQAMPNATRHYDPLVLRWEWALKEDVACTDDEHFYSAGTSTHELFLTLGPPQLPASRRFFSTLRLSIGDGHETTAWGAANETWSLFSNSPLETPKNITNWNDKGLRYYPENHGFASPCATDSVSLLLGAGVGSCDAFSRLLIDALAFNGIDSQFNTVLTKPGSDGASRWFLIGKFDFAAIPSYPDPHGPAFDQATPAEYKWFMALHWMTPGGGLSMVPDLNSGVFGDLRSIKGFPGQNVDKPSEKVFLQHFIVHVPSLGLYLDPSYGTSYTGPADFESKVVVGYAHEIPWLARGQMKVRKPNAHLNIRFIPELAPQNGGKASP